MFETGIPGLDFGYMICDSGNMFGGKTESLIKRIKQLQIQESIREEYCKKYNIPYEPLNIGIFVHSIDKRYSDGTFIVSHNGTKLPAIPVSSVQELKKSVEQNNFHVIAIDEVQFFQEKDENQMWEIVSVLKHFIDENKYVLVAGLEKDFRGFPFGPTGDLLSLSDEKATHYSICTICGGSANLPQRIVNGEPAFEDDPVVMVGAKESYEPRCRKHHVLKKREERKITQSII